MFRHHARVWRIDKLRALVELNVVSAPELVADGLRPVQQHSPEIRKSFACDMAPLGLGRRSDFEARTEIRGAVIYFLVIIVCSCWCRGNAA